MWEMLIMYIVRNYKFKYTHFCMYFSPLLSAYLSVSLTMAELEERNQAGGRKPENKPEYFRTGNQSTKSQMGTAFENLLGTFEINRDEAVGPTTYGSPLAHFKTTVLFT